MGEDDSDRLLLHPAAAFVGCKWLQFPGAIEGSDIIVDLVSSEIPNSLWRNQPILSSASVTFGFVVLPRILCVTLHFGFCRTHSAPTGA